MNELRAVRRGEDTACPTLGEQKDTACLTEAAAADFFLSSLRRDR